jgi:hypothetical protein
LGGIEDTQIDTFLQNQRFGIEKVFDTVVPRDRISYAPLLDFTTDHIRESKPDIVISITTAYELNNRDLAASYEHLFSQTSANLYLVVHHPPDIFGGLLAKVFQAWIAADRLRFITLSPHVGNFMRDRFLPLYHLVAVKTDLHELITVLRPVFQIDNLLEKASSPLEKQWYTIQGDLVKSRGANRD